VRVRHYARVFLNGQECGENFGARAPFEIDVTDAAKPGESNRLEVWVHECSGAYAMKGKTFTDKDIETVKRLSTFEGYQKTATIAEDVFLVSRPALYVSDVLAMPSVRENKLDVRISVRNETKKPRTVKLRNRVCLEGKTALTLPEQSMTIAPGEENTLVISSPWKEPKLWGFGEYGSPVLYHLETILQEDEAGGVDRLVNRFGFREMWVENDKIMFNGKNFRILAYWQPEGSGKALWTLRMAAVQAAGCNTIHNHAEQREPAFYDAADEMGILVWDANFCGGPLGTSANMMERHVFPELRSELARQYPEWIRTIGNHPSVAVIMIGCLIDHDTNKAMAELYRKYDPTRLLQSNGGGPSGVLDLGSYTSHFTMFKEDPLGLIKSSYESWGRHQWKKDDGTVAPIVNSECWYETSVFDEKEKKWLEAKKEDTAKATTEAVKWLGGKPLAGLNLYSQQAFDRFGDESGGIKIEWPSRSGLSQHSATGVTGGLSWGGVDYVNYWDPEKPAWKPNPVFAAMRPAAQDFMGYEMPIGNTRRPSVLVQVVRDGKPVSNAYVYAEALEGTTSNTLGMRTDADGTAWFELRDAGTWRFSVQNKDLRSYVDVAAPIHDLDAKKGGLGRIIGVKIDLDG